jgi:hypothetical protein
VLRSLIDHIELHPRRSQGQSVDAVLYGDLAEILAFALPRNARKNSPEQPFQGVNCRWLRGLEATYTEHESITNEKPGSKPPIPNTTAIRARRLKIGPNPGLATILICSSRSFLGR